MSSSGEPCLASARRLGQRYWEAGVCYLLYLVLSQCWVHFPQFCLHLEVGQRAERRQSSHYGKAVCQYLVCPMPHCWTHSLLHLQELGGSPWKALQAQSKAPSSCGQCFLSLRLSGKQQTLSKVLLFPQMWRPNVYLLSSEEERGLVCCHFPSSVAQSFSSSCLSPL